MDGMHALYNYNEVVIMKNLWNFERPMLRLNKYSQFNDMYGIPTMYMQKDSSQHAPLLPTTCHLINFKPITSKINFLARQQN
jgi:hypothetical protein